MRSAKRSARLGWFALLAVFAMGGCVDEKIVEVPADIFDPPSEAARSMLGYSNQETGLTVCGNCHVQAQTRWVETAHADAWAGLQSSDHASESCEGCHTVNQLGNTETEASGYLGIPEDRYHDVQCESCHGPGLKPDEAGGIPSHVESPQKANVPLAPVTVGVSGAEEGCAECHNGGHHPFVEQWELSAHATMDLEDEDAPANRESCAGCHEGGGVLAGWGEDTNYLNKGEPFAITCAVCHDPHGKFDQDGNPIPGQLRFAVGGVANIEDNLCSQCHNRRSEPSNSGHGLHPHSPETALLSGEAGFFFPGMIIDRGDIVATHGSEANERLCAGCHVLPAAATDSEGDFFQSVGHTFQAAPCVEEGGKPTGGDCGLGTDVRDYQGCAVSGCHGSVDGAQAALLTAAVRFKTLHDELHDLLVEVDPNLDEPGGEIDPNDGVLTTAEGAFFNMELAAFGGPEEDRPTPLLAYAGTAAHNPFLVEQLLIASIQAVEDMYGVPASPGINLSRTMDPR